MTQINHSSSYVPIQNHVPIQIENFLALVHAVNEIPHVQIHLDQQQDPQRDALAFIVDTIYRQFKNENWPQLLQRLPKQVKEWNTPKSAARATSSLLQFIQHLFDYRIAEIKQERSTEQEKEWVEEVRKLYQATTTSILKTQKKEEDKPLSIGGIPREMLPQWYLNKEYLKNTGDYLKA